GETERLRRFEIKRQVEFHRLLDWQVGGLFAFENSAGVGSGEAKRIGNTRAVAHEATSGDRLAQIMDCWHRVARRQADKKIVSSPKECIGADDNRVDPLFCEVREGSIDLVIVARALYREA